MATNNQGNKQSSPGASQGKGTSNRGFASMDPERQRQIASEGGKAAHQKGTAHEFTSEEARRAGSMSHGNRQSSDTSTRVGGEGSKQGGSKDDAGQSKQRGQSGSTSAAANKSR